MGDAADFALEQVVDTWSGPLAYPRRPGPKNKTCRYCGKKRMHFRCVYGKWLLYESDGNFHNCPQNPYLGYVL